MNDFDYGNPRVSVCIPTYNYGRYIAEAMESVLAQTFRDFELLVVDNCSSDETDAVMQDYVTRDVRIRYIKNLRNVGMVENWNICLEEARGEYIKFIFSDDLFSTYQALEKMVAVLDADSSISLVGSARKILDEESNLKDIWSFFECDTIKNGKEIIEQCLLAFVNFIGEPSAVLFRKQQACKGFDPKYRQLVDLELWLHLLEQGRFAYLAEPLCAFRIHSEQQTAKNDKIEVSAREHLFLCKDYLSKPYIGMNWFQKKYFVYNYVYEIWKSYWKDNCTTRESALKIIRVYGTLSFFALLPLYKTYKPLRKLFARLELVMNG